MKSFVGLLVGCLLTYAVLEFDYSTPDIIDLPNKVKALPEQLIASIFIEDPKASLAQKQKAIAILVKNSEDYFIEIDNASNNQFTLAAVNKITEQRISLVKTYTVQFAKVLTSDDYPSLKQHIINRYQTSSVNELKVKVLIEQIIQDAFLHEELKKRYSGQSDEQIAKHILQIPDF